MCSWYFDKTLFEFWHFLFVPFKHSPPYWWSFLLLRMKRVANFSCTCPFWILSVNCKSTPIGKAPVVVQFVYFWVPVGHAICLFQFYSMHSLNVQRFRFLLITMAVTFLLCVALKDFKYKSPGFCCELIGSIVKATQICNQVFTK